MSSFLPCAQTDKHLELPVLADVSGCVVDGAHEAAEGAHSGLPVLIWGHLPLLSAFEIHLCLFWLSTRLKKKKTKKTTVNN